MNCRRHHEKSAYELITHRRVRSNMGRPPRLENIVAIREYKPANYKSAPRGQGCIRGCHIHNRATVYIITTKKGNEFTIHPKCFGIIYGRAGKKLLKKILEVAKKPKPQPKQ
jgi:hypothetical protein